VTDFAPGDAIKPPALLWPTMQERHEITVDNERVVAVHHDAPTENWVVFCHGFQSDKSGSYETRCKRAVTEGYNAVRFDFRGCGESDRDFDEQTLSSRIADLRAVIDHFDPASYVVFGSSFGGKVAFHADDDRIEAIATRAPVTYNRAFEDLRQAVDAEAGEESAEREENVPPGASETAEDVPPRNSETAEDVPPGNWTSFFADLDEYPFEEAAAAVSVPVAIFHGRADDSVPIAGSIEAAGALAVDVLLQAYAGEGHLFSRAAEARMRDHLFEWLSLLD
jgi:pimeloyl-ACP methyl ester carboxylesterase